MSTVQPTDKTLVNRAGVDHSAPADMSTVQDTDILLINRAGVDYKCTFADWKASQVSVNKPSLVTPADGATDLSTAPTFTSSAFSGTGATHANSDWQVTLKTDTGFASPVVQSMADTTNKVSWTPATPLAEETDYIARVRHNGSGGLQSPWSDVISFKTEKKKADMNKPGLLYYVAYSDQTLQKASTPPAKLVNFVTSYQSNHFGIGVDGNTYQLDKSNISSGAWTKMASYTGGKAASFSTVYNDSQDHYAVLQTDGTLFLHGIKGTGLPPDKIKNFAYFGSGPNFIAIITEKNEVWAYPVQNSAKNLGSYTFSSWDSSWVNSGITLPAGETIHRICGIPDRTAPNYSAANIAILTDSGKVYTVCTGASGPGINGGPPAAGTNAAPNLWLTGVANIAAIDRGDIAGGFSALMKNGEVWFGTSNTYSTGRALPSNASWQKLNTDTDWASPIYSQPQSINTWVALKKDGFLYCNNAVNSVTVAPVKYGSHAKVQITDFGTLTGSQQGFKTDVFIIIPDS